MSQPVERLDQTTQISASSSSGGHRSLDVENLVCKLCWVECFSTQDFREVCYFDTFEPEVRYTRELDDVRASAEQGCKWCVLVLGVHERAIVELSPSEYGSANPCEVRLISRRGQEGCIPEGNNMFNLEVTGYTISLCAFTDADNICAEIVTGRPLRIDVGSERSYEDIKEWFATCVTHTECPKPLDRELPTRVIEVGEEGCRSPRLVLSKGAHAKYAALSYCWGADQPGKTVRSNLQDRLDTLNMDSVSCSVRQAIEVTRRIGLKYLWVDVLCILQDDENDKIKEITRMCDIYQNAYVTIVAANSANASEGFVRTTSNPVSAAFQIPFWKNDTQLGSVFIEPADSGTYDYRAEPIDTRAWTLQERRLSSRLLVFASHTIQLECQRMMMNLGSSLNLDIGSLYGRLPSIMVDASDTNSEAMPTRRSLTDEWQGIIMRSSRMKTTLIEDKFVALAALAEKFQPLFGESYLAGLWGGPALPELLLWRPTGRISSSSSGAYVAPSWSWASCTSDVVYSYREGQDNPGFYQVKIMSAYTTPTVPALPFGAISSGRLVLKAMTKSATFVPPDSLRGENWSEPPNWPYSYPRYGFGMGWVERDHDAYAQLDRSDVQQETPVICLALSARTYDRSMFTVIDGLLIEEVAGNQMVQSGTYRRIGYFFGAQEEDFRDALTREIWLD